MIAKRRTGFRYSVVGRKALGCQVDNIIANSHLSLFIFISDVPSSECVHFCFI